MCILRMCMHKQINIYIYILNTYIYIYVYVHIYIYIYIYIHTLNTQHQGHRSSGPTPHRLLGRLREAHRLHAERGEPATDNHKRNSRKHKQAITFS